MCNIEFSLEVPIGTFCSVFSLREGLNTSLSSCLFAMFQLVFLNWKEGFQFQVHLNGISSDDMSCVCLYPRLTSSASCIVSRIFEAIFVGTTRCGYEGRTLGTTSKKKDTRFEDADDSTGKTKTWAIWVRQWLVEGKHTFHVTIPDPYINGLIS